MVRRQPEASALVLLDGCHAAAYLHVLGAVGLHAVGQQVVAVEAVAGGNEQASAELLGDEGRRAVHQAVLPEGVGPAVALHVEAAHAHGRGQVDAFAVGRERQLRDVVVGQAVHVAVALSSPLGGVGLHRAVGREPQQSVAHGAQPEVVLGVVYDAEHADVPSRQQRLLVVASARVDVAASLLIAAQPDAPLVVFVQREHRRRHAVAAVIVPDELSAFGNLKDTVLVGTHPDEAAGVYHRARHAGLSDDVVLAQPVAHVGETVLPDGLHVDTLLQHAQPEVAARVFGDRHHLRLREVHHAAVVGILHHAARGGVQDAQSAAVVADDHLVAAVAVEGCHRAVARGGDVPEGAAL